MIRIFNSKYDVSQEKHIHKSIFLNEKKYLFSDSY